MTREIKTLRCLFPEPKPPRRKNFIKENVKSVRKMEQLFHSDSQEVKDLKLSTLNKHKFPVKHRSISNSQGFNEHKVVSTKTIEEGIASLLLQKSSDRKTSAPVFSYKKPSLKKQQLKPSVNKLNVKRVRSSKDNAVSKIENKNSKSETQKSACAVNNKLNSNYNDNSNDVKLVSLGIQTVDTEDIDSLYSEGIIRYPSTKFKNSQNDLKEDNPQEIKNNENCIDSECQVNDSKDYVKINKEKITLASKLASQLSNSSAQISHRMGVVPKYIKERKEELVKEKLAKAAAKQSDCPVGHVPIPDNERKETLAMLKKNHQELVNELNMLPIRTDTLRSQKRKMEIEKNLEKLEEAIKVFSRPKVYVKVDS
ncbi:hypothetical protein TKK_0018726 [Trichogramma kaykai]|uniref:Enkurin domain-containing protein n=1 Tax=Trichogramma kaykai TaxID=54128 RepID=A0ABD2VY88_9HYME